MPEKALSFRRGCALGLDWPPPPFAAGAHVDVTSNEQGSLFPLGTKQQDYQVFDSTLKKPVTFHYKGITATDGVATYIFVAKVPSVQIGTESLPGSCCSTPTSRPRPPA